MKEEVFCCNHSQEPIEVEIENEVKEEYIEFF